MKDRMLTLATVALHFASFLITALIPEAQGLKERKRKRRWKKKKSGGGGEWPSSSGLQFNTLSRSAI